MRRKTSSSGNGGYNNQNKRPRFQQGGSQGHHHHNQGRPRKNYPAMREKYLAQARDALAAGDRVLAENYFQHADHCYRMMMEEGYQPRQQYQQTPQDEADGTVPAAPQADDIGGDNANQLPAFLTANYDAPQQNKQPEPVAVQNWEE